MNKENVTHSQSGILFSYKKIRGFFFLKKSMAIIGKSVDLKLSKIRQKEKCAFSVLCGYKVWVSDSSGVQKGLWKGKKGTSGEENKEGGGSGMHSPGEQKGPSERRGGTSKWEQEERKGESVLVQTVCSSFSGTNPDPDVSQQQQAKTQPRRNILQGKTRPPGWVEGRGWGEAKCRRKCLVRG